MKNSATVVPGQFDAKGHDYRADLLPFLHETLGFDATPSNSNASTRPSSSRSCSAPSGSRPTRPPGAASPRRSSSAPRANSRRRASIPTTGCSSSCNRSPKRSSVPAAAPSRAPHRAPAERVTPPRPWPWRAVANAAPLMAACTMIGATTLFGPKSQLTQPETRDGGRGHGADDQRLTSTDAVDRVGRGRVVAVRVQRGNDVPHAEHQRRPDRSAPRTESLVRDGEQHGPEQDLLRGRGHHRDAYEHLVGRVTVAEFDDAGVGEGTARRPVARPRDDGRRDRHAHAQAHPSAPAFTRRRSSPNSAHDTPDPPTPRGRPRHSQARGHRGVATHQPWHDGHVRKDCGRDQGRSPGTAT